MLPSMQPTLNRLFTVSMGLVDQLPSDVLPHILAFCPTKQAFENFARTCKALKESSECKKLLVTKRKLVWRDKIARNEAVLRHGGTVYACSFSADGARIETMTRGGSVQTVHTWDAETGAALSTLERPYMRYNGATSPDGTRWINLESPAELYDPEGGTMLHQLRGGVSSLSFTPTLRVFSPDSTRVVTAGNKVRIFSAVDGALLTTLQGHTASAWCAEFSPDGARVVTASYDRTARVWDAATGATLMTLRGHTSLVYCCAFSPDGSRVVTGGWDGTARVWDVRATQR
jgi:WD40 repeat protein